MPVRYLWDTQQVFSRNAASKAKNRTQRNSPPSFSHSRSGSRYPWGCFPSRVAGSDKGRGIGREFSTYLFHTCISSYLLQGSAHRISAETSLFFITKPVQGVRWVYLNPCTALSSSSSSPLYRQRDWSGKPHFFPINIKSVEFYACSSHTFPDIIALIISYLWKKHPFSCTLSQQYARQCKSPETEMLGRWDGPVTLEFDDKLWMVLISLSQSRHTQVSESQPKMFTHSCDAVQCWRNLVPDLRSMTFRHFFNCPWKMALCMSLGIQLTMFENTGSQQYGRSTSLTRSSDKDEWEFHCIL